MLGTEMSMFAACSVFASSREMRPAAKRCKRLPLACGSKGSLRVCAVCLGRAGRRRVGSPPGVRPADAKGTTFKSQFRSALK